VDGQSVADLEAVKRLLVRRRAGDEVRLRVRRLGEELVIAVVITVFQ
ncbi:MAG: hypothetical protein H0W72_16150, partial [Planctomycetes bacterium]|nr:hypothetical protein [Planctomycetota bacterium]